MKKSQIAIAVLGTLLVVAAAVLLYAHLYARIDYSAIDYISTLQKGANSFSDLAGDIAVESVEDLGFEVTGDYQLVIHYGKQIIKVNKNCLTSDEWKLRAGRIGIEVLTHVNEDGTVLYRVTYWGEPITQWSLVT